MPNNVKLKGSKNYLSWARRVNVLLGAKGVEHYLEEDCVEPVNKLSTEWRVWHTTNSTVVAWLMASMSYLLLRWWNPCGVQKKSGRP